jgi:hypothetical protein
MANRSVLLRYQTIATYHNIPKHFQKCGYDTHPVCTHHSILLLKLLKSVAKYGWHLSNLVVLIHRNIFVQIELHKWLDKPFEDHNNPPDFLVRGGTYKLWLKLKD